MWENIWNTTNAFSVTSVPSLSPVKWGHITGSPYTAELGHPKKSTVLCNLRWKWLTNKVCTGHFSLSCNVCCPHMEWVIAQSFNWLKLRPFMVNNELSWRDWSGGSMAFWEWSICSWIQPLIGCYCDWQSPYYRGGAAAALCSAGWYEDDSETEQKSVSHDWDCAWAWHCLLFNLCRRLRVCIINVLNKS